MSICRQRWLLWYAGMSTAMDEICAHYTDTELMLLADFLTGTTYAGHTATDKLADT